MTTLFPWIIVLWAVLAIAGIVTAGYLIGKVNDLVTLAKNRLAMLLDEISGIRNAMTAHIMELTETRIEIRKHSQSLLCLVEMYGAIEKELKIFEDKLNQIEPEDEIALSDLSEEFDEKMRGEWIENKAIVCRKLAELLQYTRAGEDIETIEYKKDEDTDGFVNEETALIRFRNGYTKEVRITADSGSAIVMDVIRNL